MPHHCHWPGCPKHVPPAMWGCKNHWLSLPKQLRDKIWATYVPGQEITKTPSKEYVQAALEVQEWIANKLNKGATRMGAALNLTLDDLFDEPDMATKSELDQAIEATEAPADSVVAKPAWPEGPIMPYPEPEEGGMTDEEYDLVCDVADSCVEVDRLTAALKSAKERRDDLTSQLTSLRMMNKEEPVEEVEVTTEQWQTMTIDTLNISDAIKAALRENPDKTIALVKDIGDWTASGKLLTDIPKVGQKKAEQVEAALDEFWAKYKVAE